MSPRQRKTNNESSRQPLEKATNRLGVTSTESRTQRGKAILEAWDKSRQPFILYLRKFNLTMYHGPDSRMLLENHFSSTLSLHSIGVLTVVDPAEVPLPGAYGHGAPALAVADDQWQSAVSELISKAEMIVSEVPLLGRGAALELEMCIEAGKIDQTVVIIPPPGGVFEALDDVPPINSFPRVIHLDELPELHAVSHFVFRDLVDRVSAIADLEASNRLAMVDAGRLRERFPVTFAGLREGYEKAAADYETVGQLRRSSRSYFRALVVAAAQQNDAAIAAISEEVARLALALGDRAAAVNYLKGGIKFAGQTDDKPRLQRLKEQLRQLEATE